VAAATGRPAKSVLAQAVAAAQAQPLAEPEQDDA
jgi:hypothetical protein